MIFDTHVAGIPCQCAVTSYKEPRAFRQHTFAGAGPGDCDPPEEEEFEYQLLDRKGYPAPWLEAKLNTNDSDRLFREYTGI